MESETNLYRIDTGTLLLNATFSNNKGLLDNVTELFQREVSNNIFAHNQAAYFSQKIVLMLF